MRSPVRIALACIEARISGTEYLPFSFGPRRIHASLFQLDRDVEVIFVELQTTDVDEWVARLEALDADVVGLSMYVWSFATFIAVARRLKANRPDRLIVLGGPSAHPEMFALAPYRGAEAAVDAMVPRDGEQCFVEMIDAVGRGADIRAAMGLLVVDAGTFRSTGKLPLAPLDALPSPTQLGLVPVDHTMTLETYRGCPMSCAFCAWGTLDDPSRVFSTEYLENELRAIRRYSPPSVQSVDAGLNLNSRAFKNLCAAEAKVGLFQDTRLYACLYPTMVNAETIDFLRSIRRPRLEIGIQSLNKDALTAMDRPFRASAFARIVEHLAEFAEVELEIILGLPGDSPAAFRTTLARLRELPCRVRVFHCLVLPDALLGRSGFDLRFDPVTMQMESCLGWSAEDLLRERDWLFDRVARDGGQFEDAMWQFAPRDGDPSAPKWRAPAGGCEIDALRRVPILQVLAESSRGTWSLRGATRQGDEVHLDLLTPDGPLTLVAHATDDNRPFFQRVDGLSFSYRSPRQDVVQPTLLRDLRRLVSVLPPVVQPCIDERPAS